MMSAFNISSSSREEAAQIWRDKANFAVQLIGKYLVVDGRKFGRVDAIEMRSRDLWILPESEDEPSMHLNDLFRADSWEVAQ